MNYARKINLPCVILLFAILFAAGCSLNYTEDTTGQGTAVDAADYLPLSLNSTWTKTSGLAGAIGRSTYTDTIEDTLSSGENFYYIYKHGNGGLELWRLDANTLYTSPYSANAGKTADNVNQSKAMKPSATEMPYLVFGVAPGTTWPISSGSETINGADVSWVMTGTYKGTEDVIGTSEAGPFPECPKIEITNIITTSPQGQPPTSRTEILTLWFAKNVGIVRESLETRIDNQTSSKEITSLLEWYIPKIPDSFSINGVVTDSTDTGVQNVKFTIARIDSSSADSTSYSGQRGAYAFKGVRKGTYIIVPELKGYIFKPDTLFVRVTNKPLTDQNVMAILLPKKFAVSGSVLDNKGEGLEGVSLTLSNGQSVNTNAAGQFIIPNVVEGAYELVPYIDGYAFSPDSLKITVLGADQKNLLFTGTPGAFNVSGIVTDTDNKPLEGVNVFLDNGISFITGASGYYTFAEVPNGKHTLTPVLTGWTFTPEFLEITVAGKDFTTDPIIGTPPKLYTLGGKVSDSAGASVPGASIALSDGRSVTSGEDGTYSFPGTPEGIYTVRPSLEGWTFKPDSLTVGIKGADITGADFTASKIIIKYPVSGTVSETGGTPVEGVTVSVSGDVSSVTGADGTYRMELPDGSYTLTPSLGNYTFVPESRVVDVAGAAVGRVDFTGSLPVIPQFYSISGFVRNADGKGISGATVSLGNSGSVNTGADGSYLFASVQEGAYTIRAVAEGYTLSPDVISVQLSGGNLDNQNFTAIVIIKTYSISGTVRNQSGAGLAGVSISLGNGSSVATAQDGSYSFAGVVNGSYTLSPSLSGWEFNPASSSVTVNGENIINADFTGAELPKTYSVSGTVRNQSGAGLAGVSVSLGNGVSVSTAQDGSYTFSGVVNGSYTLSPSLSGWAFNPANSGVNVSDADLHNVDFTGAELPKTYSISGAVRNQSGTGLAGVSIALGNGVSVSTAQDGSYSFAGVVNGTYILSPSLSGWAFNPSNSGVTVSDADIRNVDFIGGELPKTYSISGTVRNQSGAGLAGVSIALGNGVSVATAQDGSYLFAGVSNGSYTLSPSLSGWAFNPSNSGVTVSDADIRNVDFIGGELPKTYSISGIVRDQSGAGIAGVSVSLGNNVSVATAQDGSYTFAGVSNGSYTLSPSLSGWTFNPANSGVTVSDADIRNIDFIGGELPKTYSISGIVRDQSGAGLAGVSIALGNNVSVATAQDGSYSFAGVSNGSYTLSPSLDGWGFNPTNRNVNVDGANISGIDFTGGKIIIQTFGISGRITDEKGGGIPDVTVNISNGSSFVTNSNGNYLFTGLMNGTYNVSVSLAGWVFTPESRQIGINNSDVWEANFVGTAIKPPSYRVSGSAVDEKGAGVEGVLIEMSSAVASGAGGNIMFNVSTSSDGSFGFNNVPAGEYGLTASKGNWAFQPLTAPVTVQSADVTGIVFTGKYTPPTYQVSGTVIIEEVGQTLSGVVLTINIGDTPVTAVSDNTGAFVFKEVPDGNYTITPSLEGYRFIPESSPITVAGAGVSGISIKAGLENYLVEGSVKDSKGNPIQSVEITAADAQGVKVSTVSTNQSGEFGLPLKVGSYTLITVSEGYVFAPSPLSVTVTTAGIKDILITGTPITHEVSGKVIFSGGAGASGTALSMYPSDGSPGLLNTVADNSGAFVFSGVINGNYMIKPSGTNMTFAPDIANVNVNGADVSDITFMAIKLYRISGKVTDSAGTGIPSAVIKLSISGTETSVSTDTDGNYSFSGLSGGSYIVTPFISGYIFNPANASVSLTTQDAVGINFTGSIPTYTITGKVLSVYGTGVPGIIVFITGGTTLKATTDANGNFYISGITNGTWAVQPSSLDYTFSPSSANVTVNGANASSPSFTGTAVVHTYSVSGKVTDSNGQGMPDVLMRLNSGAGLDTVRTTSVGNYLFQSKSSGAYTLSAFKIGYSFTLPSRSLNLNSNIMEENFTGAIAFYSIHGMVTSGGNPLSGVQINCVKAGKAFTAYSGVDGSYTVSGLPDTSTYTLTPAKPGYKFTPASSTADISGGDVSGKDFSGALPSVGGRVTLNGNGLSGVLITLSVGGAVKIATGAAIPAPIMVNTDNNGYYQFNDIPPGTYMVTSSKTGYTISPPYSYVTVNGENITGINFTAAPNFIYSISGTVSDSGGVLSGVTVNLSGAGSDTTVSTNSDGYYVFTSLPPGNYTVTTSKAGYTLAPSSRSVSIPDDPTTNINFAATLIPTYSISGNISFISSGVSGATVTLSGAGTGVVETIADGNYVFTGLLPGSYTITPSKAGMTFTPASYTVIVTDSNITGRNFIIPAYSISGSVSYNGGVLSGVTVTLSGAGTDTVETNADGNYVFANLTTGNYTVTPSKSGYTLTPSSTNVSVTDSSKTGISFTATLIPTYSISGNISFNSSGVSGATVTLSGAGTGTVETITDGNYVFTGLLPGNYTVTPSKAGKFFTPASYTVTVADSNLTGRNFIIPSYSISGAVSYSGGVLSGVTVTLSGAGTGTATTNGDGNYVFTGLIQGNYSVKPSKTDYSMSPDSTIVSVTDSSRTGISFTATLIPAYSISGFVSYEGVRSGVTVTLSGAGSNTVSTNSDGYYEFTHLSPGNYVVTPTKSGYTLSPSSTNVSISDGNWSEINFAAALITYSIIGNIQSFDANASLPGATVTLSGAASDTTVTDDQGNYGFTTLLPGDYTVTPSKTGYIMSPDSTIVSISNGNRSGIDFEATIIPTYSIKGKVHGDEDLPGFTVTISGAASGTTLTDNDGYYTFTGLLPGSYTITPDTSSYVLIPSSRNVTITKNDVLRQDFSVSSYFGGYLNYSNGGPISGETVTLKGENGEVLQSATTNADGYYEFTVVISNEDDEYTIIPPALEGYITDVPFYSVSTGNSINNNFVYTSSAYIASGRVTRPDTTIAIAGVQLELQKVIDNHWTTIATATSDSTGYYEFTNLLNNSHYKIYAIDMPKPINAYFRHGDNIVIRDVTIENGNLGGNDFIAYTRR